MWQIVVAMFPAGIAGFLLEDYINDVLRSDWVVVVMAVVVGILFIRGEKYFKANLDLSTLNWKKSLLIGLAKIFFYQQCLYCHYQRNSS